MGIDLALLGLGSLAGLMIGCVGIGGVILVPFLTFWLGMSTGEAVASAMFGYVLSGLAGATMQRRARSSDRDGRSSTADLWLCLGAAPGAVAGAFAAQLVDPRLTQGLVGGLALASGVYNLRRPEAFGGAAPVPAPGVLAILGLGTGLISAMTGTGGPVVLVPLLLARDLPVLTAVGLGQTIQIPIAALATLAAFAFGALALGPAAILAAGIGLGSLAGAWWGQRIATATLRRFAALILIGTGLFVLMQLWHTAKP